MNRRTSAGMIAVFVAAASQPSGARVDQASSERLRPVKLSGCVVAGTKPDSFLIQNARLVMGMPPAGSSPDQLYFRLDTTKGLKGHVGQQVDVLGIADFGDVDKGTREVVDQADGTVTISLRAERREVTAKTRPTDPALPAGTSGQIEVPTYKLKVESITMLSPTCPDALPK